jgi:hypothetical protein
MNTSQLRKIKRYAIIILVYYGNWEVERMKRKNHGRQAPIPASANKVAKTVIAGTIGLSLLQVPIWAGASPASVSESGTGIAKEAKAANSAAANPAPGEKAKISKEEAAKKMVALFPVLNEAKLEDASYTEGTDNSFNESVWMLTWTITRGNSTYSFSASVDGMTGDVLNFYQPEYVSNESKAYYPPEISQEQAEKAAKAFIVQAASSIKADDLVPQEGVNNGNQSLFGQVVYNFSYSAKVNGIPSDGENIQIGVDGKGRIFSYNRMSTSKSYPSANPKISSSDALESFQKDLSLGLAYVQFNDYYNPARSKKDWRLAYIPAPSITMTDANTGKRFNPLQNSEQTVPKALEYTALPSGSASFKAHQGNTLTSKEVLQLYPDLVPSSKDYSLSSSLTNYWMDSGKQVWSLNWYKKSALGMSGDSVYMMVDAGTGQLISYNINELPAYAKEADNAKPSPITDAKSNAPGMSASEAQKKAFDLAGRYYPEAAKALKLSNDSSTDQANGKTVHRFVFQQFYKDLPVYNQQVSLVLDGSGKLLSYNANLPLTGDDRQKLDALTAKIKPEDAAKTYREALGAQLIYASTGGYYVESKFAEPRILLAYAPTFNGDRRLPFINAVTGKNEFYGYFGTQNGGADPAANLPSDAVGHGAGKELATLLEYGVIAPESDGLLHPDKEITYGDLLAMIAKGVSPTQSYYDPGRLGKQFKDVPADSPYAEAVQMFADRGWLRNTSGELHPEQKLTREKLAETIVNVLRYDKLSAFYESDPQILALADAQAIQNKGAVKQAIQLGLMSAKDGKFEPARPVTKAEAAQVLVLLAQIQGKVDSPVAGY